MNIPCILAATGASAVIAVGMLASASAAEISCYDAKIYNTVGSITCRGTGLFRAKGDCVSQLDQYSGWVRIRDSAATAFVECRFKIRGVSAETRPGA